MSRPRSYDDALRIGLLEAATRRIASNGSKALSLRELAAEEHTSTNAVYAIFGGKPQMVAAVLAGVEGRFTQMQRHAAGPGTSLSDLRRLSLAHRRWALANLQLYRELFGGTSPWGELASASLSGGAVATAPSVASSNGEPAGAIGPLLATVRHLTEAGIMHDGEPEVAATSIWAAVHGMVAMEVRFWSGAPSADTLFAAHLRSVERGWLTPAGLVAAAAADTASNARINHGDASKGTSGAR